MTTSNAVRPETDKASGRTAYPSPENHFPEAKGTE